MIASLESACLSGVQAGHPSRVTTSPHNTPLAFVFSTLVPQEMGENTKDTCSRVLPRLALPFPSRPDQPGLLIYGRGEPPRRVSSVPRYKAKRWPLWGSVRDQFTNPP